jgi:hypothetical protein
MPGPANFTPQRMGVGLHAENRAVQGMTIGTIMAREHRRAVDWEDALDEYDQQFMIPFAGDVNNHLSWADVHLDFSLVFVYNADRDNVPNADARPVFTYGWEWKKGERLAVMAHVSNWDEGDNGCYGCKLWVGMFNPAVGALVHSEGIVHVNFQGYASPVVDEEGLTESG